MEMMNSVPYRGEAEEILRRLPLMRLSQFIRALSAWCGTGPEGAEWHTRLLAQEGMILISDNGLVTSKEALGIVSPSHAPAALSGPVRLSSLSPDPFFLRCADCFDIILNMYPASRYFTVTRSAFQASFADTARNRVYEIARVPDDGWEAFYLSAARESLPYLKGRNRDYLSCLRRIAVTGDEAMAAEVPYYGFTHICVTDRNTENGFRVVERRREDIWRDLPVT